MRGEKPQILPNIASNRNILRAVTRNRVIKRVVKSRLIDHLTSSKLLNPHQSAYCKHYSTETALLYIHDSR